MLQESERQDLRGRSCKVCGKNSAVLVHASQEPPGELRHTLACGDLGLYVGIRSEG
jgi:hypothetical protein